MCAASWRITSKASAPDFGVIISILASASISRDKSRNSPSTLIAKAIFDKEIEMALAISPPVTPEVKSRAAPSGKVIFIT